MGGVLARGALRNGALVRSVYRFLATSECNGCINPKDLTTFLEHRLTVFNVKIEGGARRHRTGADLAACSISSQRSPNCSPRRDPLQQQVAVTRAGDRPSGFIL